LSSLAHILEGPLFPIVVVAWLAGWVIASIIYRLQRGKPIIPRLPDDALYRERTASGRSRKSFLTMLGGASNCLMVAVTPDEFIVTPFFPFTLIFLPEIYDLEVRVPRSRVRVVKESTGLLGRSVVLAIEGADPRELILQLRDRAAFLAALALPVSRSSRRDHSHSALPVNRG
jgi:hypothetical protein